MMLRVLKSSIFFSLFFGLSQAVFGWAGGPKTLFVEGGASLENKWYDGERTREESLTQLVDILNKSATGSKILVAAKEKAALSGQTLLDVLEPGDSSYLDTTLVRRFTPDNPGEVMYENRFQVFIDRSLRVSDAVLDMAHELTHYVFRTPFNPYENHLSLDEFVASTIEGRGGEVEAFMIECQVMAELFKNQDPNRYKCDKIRDEKGRISKAKTIKQFYNMGEYYKDFRKRVHDHKVGLNKFSYLGKEEALFISSAYGVPYPLAAVEEYTTITERVCRNDRRRLSYFQNENSRSLASSTKSISKHNAAYHKRCGHVSH